MPRRADDDRALRSHLEASPPERLVELLLEQAGRDDDLRARLLIEAAREGRTTIDRAAARRDIREALLDFDGSRRGGGYTSARWARAAGEVAGHLHALLDAGFADEAVELTEHALVTIERAMSRVDDSYGYFAGISDQLVKTHHAACLIARPDPVALARRLFKQQVDGDWELFDDVVDGYADVLGEPGLAEYRRLAQARWARVRALGPADRYGSASYAPGRHALTRIMERLAERAGDVDALIEVKRRDLSSPYAFFGLAELCAKAGRSADALTWAERGVAAFPDWPDERLDAFLCDAYRGAGRDADAVALAWRRFDEGTTLATYRFLVDVARRAGALEPQRERAIDQLARAADAEARAGGGPGSAAVSRSLLVEVLLFEGRIDEAWAEATARGVSEGTWMLLAGARAESHPADAIPIYQRDVQETLRFADKRAYEDAVAMLHRVRDLYARAGRPAEFDDYVAGVRVQHKAKRNLMKLFDAEGW